VAHVEEVIHFLTEWGLLLLQDSAFPSLVGRVAGEKVRGSWWAHAKGHEIFDVANRVAEHEDIACAKLVSGKVTFVHRKLWPSLVAVGRGREAWQLDGLSKEARVLLARVEREQNVQARGKAAKELELRLLVASEEVHTESGAHALELTTWEAFAKRRKLRVPAKPSARARAELDAVLAKMNATFGATAKFPW
jgi:hypothetical protein